MASSSNKEEIAIKEKRNCPQSTVELEEKTYETSKPQNVKRRNVRRSSRLVPLDREQPLLPQIQIIWDKIKDNVVDGDLEDQFPSLIGKLSYSNYSVEK